MKKLKDLPDFGKPREKLIKKGVKSLSDVELVALVIVKGVSGRDVLQVAMDIFKKLNITLDKFSYQTFQNIPGVGIEKACQLMAGFELSRRYDVRSSEKISSPANIVPLVSYIADKKQEYFVCIFLNGVGEVISNRVVTVVLLDHTLVHPREVFEDPITDRAASVVLVHNHPSGTLKPGKKDICMTERLIEAGKILGIKVLDHLIITKNGYMSMKGKNI